MASSENSVWVKVPFSFYAGETQMPAGTYMFSMKTKPFNAGSVLKIVSQDGSICKHLSTNRLDGNPSISEVTVYFNKYGDSHFLSKVKGRSLGAEVARSRAEKQLEGTYSKEKVSSRPTPKSKPQRSGK